MKKKPAKKAAKKKPATYSPATGHSLLRAYGRAAKRFGNDGLLRATSQSAGFIIPAHQKVGERFGFQVFVRMVRFSEKLLKEEPKTGGLLA
jgi:hypothetical protein